MSARAAALLLLSGALAACGAAPARRPLAPSASAQAAPSTGGLASEGGADEAEALTPRMLDELLGALGRLATSFRAGPYDDPALQGYVASVGQRVAAGARLPGQTLRFVVVDDPEVQAWALPGGRVEVARGLLAALETESELAAVLAHEIAHQEQRHAAHTFWRRALSLDDAGEMAQRYDQDKEHQADRRGLWLLGASGYEPWAMARLLVKMESTSRALGGSPASTWPRVARVLRHTVDHQGAEKNAEAYLDHMEGLVFGQDRRQGVLRGRTFTCERDGFAIDLPAGWEGIWSERSLQARGPGEATLRLRYQREGADLLSEAARRLVEGQPHRQTEALGWPLLVRGGLDEAVALWQPAGALWWFEVWGPGAEATLRVILASLRRARPDPANAPTRLVLRRTERGASFADAVAAVCPGPQPLPLLEALHGASADRSVEAKTRLRCLSPPP